MKKYFYKTILQHNEHEIPKIKGSRFIGNIFHIKNKEEAEKHIKEVSEKHKGANHNCYAYTYGTNINFDLFGQLEITADYFKQNDDGEPTNTAGKPILAQIQGHNLHNILIVITRYFGGTLLGVGGLIQAYSECAKQTILNSNLPAGRQGIKNIEITETIKISFDYNILSNIMNLINKYEAKIDQENHGEKAEITLKINKGYLEEFKKEIFNQSKGKIKL
ncbi:MAG TPA: YigZ family protein [Candidatus Absconditabacterales bacterium]|nr:YigZ family protein [Candidatus Absconditabacterales bacterium]